MRFEFISLLLQSEEISHLRSGGQTAILKNEWHNLRNVPLSADAFWQRLYLCSSTGL